MLPFLRISLKYCIVLYSELICYNLNIICKFINRQSYVFFVKKHNINTFILVFLSEIHLKTSIKKHIIVF